MDPEKIQTRSRFTPYRRLLLQNEIHTIYCFTIHKNLLKCFKRIYIILYTYYVAVRSTHVYVDLVVYIVHIDFILMGFFFTVSEIVISFSFLSLTRLFVCYQLVRLKKKKITIGILFQLIYTYIYIYILIGYQFLLVCKIIRPSTSYYIRVYITQREEKIIIICDACSFF